MDDHDGENRIHAANPFERGRRRQQNAEREQAGDQRAAALDRAVRRAALFARGLASMICSARRHHRVVRIRRSCFIGRTDFFQIRRRGGARKRRQRIGLSLTIGAKRGLFLGQSLHLAGFVTKYSRTMAQTQPALLCCRWRDYSGPHVLAKPIDASAGGRGQLLSRGRGPMSAGGSELCGPSGLARAGPVAGRWIGAVVPHAGWICSGAIAGEAIGTLAASLGAAGRAAGAGNVDVVVVFGAVHTPLPLECGGAGVSGGVGSSRRHLRGARGTQGSDDNGRAKFFRRRRPLPPPRACGRGRASADSAGLAGRVAHADRDSAHGRCGGHWYSHGCDGAGVEAAAGLPGQQRPDALRPGVSVRAGGRRASRAYAGRRKTTGGFCRS